jgi:PKD repeat protein
MGSRKNMTTQSTVFFRFLPALLILLSGFQLKSQKWVSMMQDTSANFYDIVKEFDAYWKDRPYERGHGYNAFRRWQWFVEPRVYPSGNMKTASRAYALEQFRAFQEEQAAARTISNNNPSVVSATVSNWLPLGPFGNAINASSGGEAGRIQCIAIKPGDPNTLYIGSAAGGLWFTKDGGLSYTTTTDQFASCGVSDIAIDPQNHNNIYISTGDKDAGDTHSTGILRSTDGGLTWTQTGLLWQTSQQRRIYRVLINPLNPNTLIAATSVGVYRTTNAGATWSQVLGGNFVDAEYKPGDTTRVYVVSGGAFFRSTNGGASFSAVSISGSSMNTNRLSMAVTPANDNVIYILASANNNGFGGLYRSTNGGSNFTLMSSTPNILDWSTNGSGTGGQGWYDLAIDASPTNSNEIIAGGVNTWKSTNGGSTWVLNSHWFGGGGKPLVHADLHAVKYYSGTTCFLGTDGGISRSTNSGSAWTSINGNMNIAQIYKTGLASNNPLQIITGHQDNGTNYLNGANWSFILGGDGMDCFIDWNNSNTLYASIQYGEFRRSTNGGASWVNITNGLSGTGAWVAPIVQDPTTPNTIYCGYQQVYKSTNQGTSWQALGSIGSTLDEIKVSPVGSNTIYATNAGVIWRTTNGGTTWSIISGGLPVGSAQITDLAMDNLNPNTIYVTLSGYSNGNKVFRSTNAGATWTNFSTGLPNIPVNCIIYSNNSPQALYVGTDVGVYYREASMNAWIPYFTGLPNVVVDDLEIYYPTGKLRAATYGRGVWETDLFSDPGSPPFAAAQAAFAPGCINIPLQFTDVSSNVPNAWNWTFAGGNPSVSALQNPLITYTATGTYTVQLISSNANGPSAPFITTISVVGNPTAVPVTASVCEGQTGQIGVLTNANNVIWSSGQQGLNIFVSNTITSVYAYTAALGACQVSGTSTLYVDPKPSTPTVIMFPGFIGTTVSASSFQWYLNGTAVAGATLPMFTPVQAGYYSVWVGNGNCFSSSAPVLIEFTSLKEWAELAESVNIGPNPVQTELELQFKSTLPSDLKIEIINSAGQTVYSSGIENKNTKDLKLDFSAFSAGVYTLVLRDKERQASYKILKQ